MEVGFLFCMASGGVVRCFFFGLFTGQEDFRSNGFERIAAISTVRKI